MKPKLLKTAHCGYIYADGHAVILHESKHPQAGTVQWVEIFEKLDTHCNFEGRIVFHHPHYDRKLRLALEAYALRVSKPSLENGSENTRHLGLRIGTFTVEFKDGAHLWWNLMPDVLSDGLTYQPDHFEAFNPEWVAGCSHWWDKRIHTIHRRVTEPLAAAA